MSVSQNNLLDNLQVSMLIDWNNVSNVLFLNRGCKFMQDINSLNVGLPMNSESMNVLQVRSTFIGDDELNAVVDAVIGSTATTVTLSLLPVGGNPVDFYRVGTVLFANDRNAQAKVVAAAAGQITLEPIQGVTLAQVIASFASGATTYDMGIHVDYRQSSGVPKLSYFPDIQTNYMSVLRDGDGWDRVDYHKSRIDKVGNTGMWQDTNIKRTVGRMLKTIERNWLWSVPAYDPANSYSQMGGVDWAIRNRGGVVFQYGSLPTQADFQDWLDTIFERNLGALDQTRKLYMGNKLFNHINNNFADNFIEQIDPQAIRSGATDKNMYMYRVGGRAVELETNVSAFSDPEFNAAPTTLVSLQGRRLEWTAYFIDTNPVDIAQGGTVPAIRKVHFGDSPFYAAIGKGIGDNPMAMPSEAGAAILPDRLSSDLLTMQDTTTIQFMYHGGVDMATGFYSGIFEPSA